MCKHLWRDTESLCTSGDDGDDVVGDEDDDDSEDGEMMIVMMTILFKRTFSRLCKHRWRDLETLKSCQRV